VAEPPFITELPSPLLIGASAQFHQLIILSKKIEDANTDWGNMTHYVLKYDQLTTWRLPLSAYGTREHGTAQKKQ